MGWDLTNGLKNLRAQVDTRWPDRDKHSDGTIGDPAHAAGTSGHNPDDTSYGNAEWDGDSDSKQEVRAWDMDADLCEDGTTAQMVVDHIRSLNPSSVLRYIIFNRKIYKAQNGWKPETYTGPSDHTEHIHFSGAYSQSADENTSYNYKLDQVGDTVSEQHVRQYFASAAAGVRGVKADGVTEADSADRQARKDLTDVIRFAWGLNYSDQETHNLAPARHDQATQGIASLADQIGCLPDDIATAVVSRLPHQA